jgi:hypothetical protein
MQDAKIREKYLWLKGFHNKFCNENGFDMMIISISHEAGGV